MELPFTEMAGPGMPPYAHLPFRFSTVVIGWVARITSSVPVPEVESGSVLGKPFGTYDALAVADIWSGDPLAACAGAFPVQYQVKLLIFALTDCPPLPNWTITEPSLWILPLLISSDTFPETEMLSPTALPGAGLGAKLTLNVAISPFMLL